MVFLTKGGEDGGTPVDLLKRKGQEGAELQSDRCPLASVVGN